jgi:hypothetical protein
MIKKHGRPREGGTQFDTGVVRSCIDHSSEEEGQEKEEQDAGSDNSGGNAEGDEFSGGDGGSSNGGANKNNDSDSDYDSDRYVGSDSESDSDETPGGGCTSFCHEGQGTIISIDDTATATTAATSPPPPPPPPPLASPQPAAAAIYRTENTKHSSHPEPAQRPSRIKSSPCLRSSRRQVHLQVCRRHIQCTTTCKLK